MALPSEAYIKQLHRKYAPSNEIFEEVWQHCKMVGKIAGEIIEARRLTGVDKALVAVGCLVHDVGLYRLYDEQGNMDEHSYIRHGVLGYELLKDAGFSEQICRFASHHTGVGLTADEITMNRLPLPKEDMLADTQEERLVMYADKFHSKLPSRFNSIEWYKKYVARFGENKVQIFEQMVAEFGTPDVQQLALDYNQECR